MDEYSKTILQKYYDIGEALGYFFKNADARGKEIWNVPMKSYNKIETTLQKYSALKQLERDKEAVRVWKKFELDITILERTMPHNWRESLKKTREAK